MPTYGFLVADVNGTHVAAAGDVLPVANGGNVRASRAEVAKTASFTFDLTQDERLIAASHATVAIVATVPPFSSVAWPEGAILAVEQRGAAAASLAAGSGVTINKPSGKTLVATGQYGVIRCRHTATPDTWTAYGDLGT